MTVQKNILHYYVELLRIKDDEKRTQKQSESCVTALHNVIRTMRLSRHDKICGEDLSQLDFGNIILNNLYFSNNGQNPSSFKGSKMSEWNIHGGMIGYLYYADFSDDGKSFIAICNDGKAIVWDIETYLMKKVISISKPFAMWIDDIEGFVELSKPKTFEYESPELDVDTIKKEMLSDYFFEKQVCSIISDDVKKEIVKRFKEYNNAKFDGLFSNNECIEFDLPIEFTTADRTVSYKYDLEYKTSHEEYTLQSLVLSSKGNYCIILYYGNRYLFKTKSGEIIEETPGNVEIKLSNDEKYYAVYSSCFFKVYNIINKCAILNVSRNVQKIDAVDIDTDKGICLSMSARDVKGSMIEQPIFLWNLRNNKLFGKSVLKTLEVIEYNIMYNPQFQNDKIDYFEKMALLSQMVTKNLLKPRNNITFDIDHDDDYNFLFFEIHYSADESFCLVFEHNLFGNYFQYQDRKEKIDVHDFKGSVICAVLTKKDTLLYLFTSEKKIYCWDTKQHLFINNINVEIPCELSLTSAQFSTDASYLFVGTDCGETLLIDTKKGKLIERFYHIDSLHIENCNMKQINTDELTKKILRQNGADIENPSQ